MSIGKQRLPFGIWSSSFWYDYAKWHFFIPYSLSFSFSYFSYSGPPHPKCRKCSQVFLRLVYPPYYRDMLLFCCFLSFFILSLKNPVEYVSWEGKGYFCWIPHCSECNSLGFTLLCPYKACCTSPNKTAIHFFNKSCTGVFGSVNWQLIYCLENYSLLIYITWRRLQIYSVSNQRENASVILIETGNSK